MPLPAGVFLPPRPTPVKDDGEGIPMDFHSFTASREEHHLALDIKDYINYLETRFPGSCELADFVWRSKEVLRNEMTHFDFGPSCAHIDSFKNFLAVCKLVDSPQRASTEQYREAIPEYERYLRANSTVDLAGFKAAREKQAKDDRLTLNREENPDCCCDECEEDFNFDCDSFFDTCINDADVDVLFSTPVNETQDPSLYDEDSDDSDDTIINEQREANKPKVPFSDYIKSIKRCYIPIDAYELLLADLEHYKKHYLTPRGTNEEKKLFETISTVLLINGVREGYGWCRQSNNCKV